MHYSFTLDMAICGVTINNGKQALLSSLKGVNINTFRRTRHFMR